MKKGLFGDFLIAGEIVVIGLAAAAHLAATVFGWSFSRCAMVFAVFVCAVAQPVILLMRRCAADLQNSFWKALFSERGRKVCPAGLLRESGRGTDVWDIWAAAFVAICFYLDGRHELPRG